LIEKFNFYDIYGDFLPGLALLGVLWLPYGITRRTWPASNWGSTIIAVAVAYMLGHLMLYVSTSVIPSHDVKKSSPDKDRNPSETVLDPDSSALSADLRGKLAQAVNAQFELNLHIGDGDGKYDGVRNDAFLLARQKLIRENAADYAEQFQGMYALARGLLAALAVGAVYFAGWAFSVLRGSLSFAIALGLVFLAMAVIVNLGCALLREKDGPRGTSEEREQLRRQNRTRKKRLERAYTGSLLILFCLGGYLLGLGHEMHARECALFSIFAMAAVLGCLRCYSQYRYFTVRFATTVWRDFLVHSEKDKAAKSSFFAFE
jgi:hypothetical protein